MKKLNSILFVCLFFLLTSIDCKKALPGKPADQLPAATQTGANTFGCLVDGVAFLPGGNILGGGNLQCNYMFVNKAYSVVIRGTNNGKNLKSVSVQTDSLAIVEGQSYILKTRIKGNASGTYFFGYETSAGNQILNQYLTNGITASGLLTITHLDTYNQIMSGTFWFTSIESNGDSAKITDGRFDMHFNR